MTNGKKGSGAPAARKTQELLKCIPKVDDCLKLLHDVIEAPAKLVKNAVREVLSEQRNAILAGKKFTKSNMSKKQIMPQFLARIAEKQEPNVKTVINATGVVIHTNLGRSPLPQQAINVLGQVGTRYSNLEFNLSTGKRGSRYSLVEDLLCELTGAEAGLVVNNNAAAVLLVLDTLAKDREVIVSRGQLVEIGGSFRIPDVMTKSGAKLVEVGATNRTHLRDYENAINEETALLLKVHTSNFKIVGFTKEVALEELVTLAGQHDLRVMEDLGSGSFMDLSSYGLGKEPTVMDVIKAGVDVVTFSGDKLLGGPQAGIILGEKHIIERVKQNPLNRALRIDKFTLAALEVVLRLYFDEKEAKMHIPTLHMLTAPIQIIEKRAKRLVRRIKKKIHSQCGVGIRQTEARVGGGALPEEPIKSWSVSLNPNDISVDKLEETLRKASTPIIGRIENDIFLLDMRTVFDRDIVPLADTLLSVFGEG